MESRLSKLTPALLAHDDDDDGVEEEEVLHGAQATTSQRTAGLVKGAAGKNKGPSPAPLQKAGT
jgi:hypothetical protein